MIKCMLDGCPKVSEYPLGWFFFPQQDVYLCCNHVQIYMKAAEEKDLTNFAFPYVELVGNQLSKFTQ